MQEETTPPASEQIAPLLAYGLDEAAFAEHLARCAVAATSPHATDLALAFACARGVPQALRDFEQHYAHERRALVQRAERLGLDATEATQSLHARLFVATQERAPRIGDYAGRGSLRAWYRMVGVRWLIDLSRRKRARPEYATAPDVFEAMLESPMLDPELEHFRNHYRADLRHALDQGVQNLSARHRNVLRMHLLHHNTIGQIGALYAVHPSTAYRWIEAATAQLIASMRTALEQRTGVPREQLKSLLRSLHSKLDVNLRSALRSQFEAES